MIHQAYGQTLPGGPPPRRKPARLRDYVAVAIGAVLVIAAAVVLTASWGSGPTGSTPVPTGQASPAPAISGPQDIGQRISPSG